MENVVGLVRTFSKRCVLNENGRSTNNGRFYLVLGMENNLFEIRIVILFKLGLRVEYYIVLFTAFLLWKIIFSSSSSSSFFPFFYFLFFF